MGWAGFEMQRFARRGQHIHNRVAAEFGFGHAPLLQVTGRVGIAGKHRLALGAIASPKPPARVVLPCPRSSWM